MGIRIHKSLGYGIDFKEHYPEADYSKINDFEILESEEFYAEWKEEAITWAKANDYYGEALSFSFSREEEPWLPYKSIIRETEGPDGFIQFIPVGCSAWTRYNDPIDYYEYSYYNDSFRDGNLDPKIQWLSNCLYPYKNLMRKDPENKNGIGIETHWTPCYMDTMEYKENPGDFITMVPFHLYFLIKKLEIVPEEALSDIYLKIKPCIYTYWG